MTRIAVTGAAGGVATLLRPALADRTVRLVDRRPLTRSAAAGGDRSGAIAGWGDIDAVWGDLADPAVAAAAVAGVDAVLHLAGNPGAGASWDELLGPNLAATAALLDAAAAAGVRRVVLASSVHALGGRTTDGELIDPQGPPRPCCRYGASKAFAEAAGAATASSTRTTVVCLRLGGCRPAPPTSSWAPTWIGVDDLTSLVEAALGADLRYGVYAGVSANTTTPFGPGTAERDLGWRPRQDSSTYAVPPGDGDGGLCPGVRLGQR
ncbi:NAD(P)-dependent oxidoreductase [Kribbella turkmenica]|uniref:NAD(P)-dependent oxidoreductase n=1 Tax=Kribbella turkmenica TaxID=2530375 RepID=A0A4R4WAI2_9ACTN|nr:NAD-dependent epimerase/dehydratase family protein [Kribbella turkmenica]TDD15818.1 NAD(P)-dependent oxidoreductase [Kribbella turkmenica]